MGNGHLNNKSDTCFFTRDVWEWEETTGPAPFSPSSSQGSQSWELGMSRSPEPRVRGVGMANAGRVGGEGHQESAHRAGFQTPLLLLGCGIFSKYLNFSDSHPICHQKDESSRYRWKLQQFYWKPSLGIPDGTEEETFPRQGHQPRKATEKWQQCPRE